MSRDQHKNLLLVDKCCNFTLCKLSRSRKPHNWFYNNFSILWCHFRLVCKTYKWKRKHCRHIFFEFLFHVLSKCKNIFFLIWWSYGTPFEWQIHLHWWILVYIQKLHTWEFVFMHCRSLCKFVCFENKSRGIYFLKIFSCCT